MLNPKPQYFYGGEVIDWMGFELPYIMTDEEKKADQKKRRKERVDNGTVKKRKTLFMQTHIDSKDSSLLDELNETTVLDDLPF